MTILSYTIHQNKSAEYALRQKNTQLHITPDNSPTPVCHRGFEALIHHVIFNYGFKIRIRPDMPLLLGRDNAPFYWSFIATFK